MLRPYTPRPRRALHVPGFSVIQHVNTYSAAAVGRRNYRFRKKPSRCDEDMTHELHKMVAMIAVQTKDRTISGEDSMMVIAFLQEFKSIYGVCRIHGDAAMRMFKLFLTELAGKSVKARVTLKTSANVYHEGFLKSYSAIVQHLFKHYVNDENISRLY